MRLPADLTGHEPTADGQVRRAEFPQAEFPQAEFPQAEFPQDEFPQDEFRSAGFRRDAGHVSATRRT